MRLIDAGKINFKWINGTVCVEPKDIEKMPTVRCETCRDYLTVYCPCECKSEPNWVCGDWHERKEE